MYKMAQLYCGAIVYSHVHQYLKDNAPDAEQVVMTTQRFFKGHAGPSIAWKVFIEPPGK